MVIKVDFDLKVEITPDFEKKFKNAIDVVADFVFLNAQRHIPVKSGNTRASLKKEIDYNEGYISIRWPENTKEEMIGSVLEYGSGERGEKNFRRYFDELKPQYTVPIVPNTKKYMHFVNDKGKDVFMKEFKGHMPQEPLRKALKDSLPYIQKIFEKSYR